MSQYKCKIKSIITLLSREDRLMRCVWFHILFVELFSIFCIVDSLVAKHLLQRTRRTENADIYRYRIYMYRVGSGSTIAALKQENFLLLISCVKIGLLRCPTLLAQGFRFSIKSVDTRWIIRNNIIYVFSK
jgi:hypothetical protein